jgi:GTP cyclohydrolase I
MKNLKTIDSVEINENGAALSDTGAARPSQSEAQEAVRILLAYAGEDITRAGLLETPQRVTKAYQEFFAGYAMDEATILSKNFDDITNYNDFVLVRNITMTAHCEHHMVPFTGHAHIAYWPDKHVCGISKLGRILDMYSKRFTNQETITTKVAQALATQLQPKGVAVFIEAAHNCMCGRGVNKAQATTITSQYLGVFENNYDLQRRFLDYAKS